MSHSQFHCTGRAYLDMHGLIFETSICYWQDQPGRGASTRSRACRESGAGRRGHGRGTRAGRPARRGSQGGGGEWREGARPAGRPGRAPRPAPRRGRPIARTLSVHEGRSAPPPPRGGPRRGRERAAEPPLPPPPHPPPPHREPARPGGDSTTAKATPRTADARPRRPAVTPAPEGRGTPAGEDTATGPRWARPGTRPALGRAHRSGGPRRGGGGGRSRELPLVQHATAATDRRRRNGQRIGTAAGPEARHTRARPREAADGERTEADGQTERSTDGVRPREANATEQGRCWWGGRAPPRGAWLKATRAGAGGSASRPPGPTAGSHRRRPPSTGTVPPHARDDGLAPPPPAPSRGLTPTATDTHPRAASRPGRTLSRRAPAAPTSPTRAKLPARRPASGTPPADGGRGNDTHMRRGRLGPRQGKGARGGRTRGTRRRGRQRRGGAGKHARRGPRDRAAGAIRGPQRHREHGRATRKTSAGSHRHPHTRAVPRHAWDADRSRPAPERAPTTRPRRQGRRAAQTHLPPPVLDRSVFRSKSATPRLDILGITLSSEAAPTVTARRHRLRLVGRGRAR